MKKIIKAISLILCLTLVLSMCAFADDADVLPVTEETVSVFTVVSAADVSGTGLLPVSFLAPQADNMSAAASINQPIL